jgi:hypothetical protein
MLLGGPAAGATRFDPALRFRRIETAHFIIYFHQGQSGPARRLARIAEDTWQALRTALGPPVPARTHVVLADQSDSANGWATPLPYNTIVLSAAWPAGFESIGHSDDWLRLVFTHEFTHIVHLDRSRGYARAVKSLFGRVPLAFPNLFEPTWQIEGLATYVESVITGQGRLHANDFRAIEREPARRGAAFPLSQANGGLIAWPGGHASYAYGLGFHDYLAERYGPERMSALVERTAGRLPYTGSRAYREVYGASLGALWTAYQSELTRIAGRMRAGPVVRRLTHTGFVTLGPRFAPAPCTGCESEIVYSVRNPHEFPALKALPVDGGEPRTLTRRYLGSTTAITADRILFDQQETGRNVGMYSDLYVLDRLSGAVQRLTTEARLRDPDLAPDGRTLAAVREDRGTRSLVLVPLGPDGTPGSVVPLLTEPETQYATPRWSPDGRTLAVERHPVGAGSEIVVVDPVTKGVRSLARGATRATTPAWRPDGRAIVAAADTENGPFNIFEYMLDESAVRQLTDFPGGATWPAVSPDGRTLVFVGYTQDGFDLFSRRYGPIGEVVARPSARVDGPPAATRADEAAGGPDATGGGVAADEVSADSPLVESNAPRYTPWPTLPPRAWMPLVFSDGDHVQAGVTAAGMDILGYHVISGALLWRAAAPAAAVGLPGRARPDWSVSYAYDRWRPRWFTSASRETSFLRGASALDDRPSTLVERTMEAGVFFPLRRVQRSQRLLLSGLRTTSTVARADRDESFARVAARAAWSLTTAQRYGYSISPVEGVSVGATAELAGTGLDRLSDAATVTADARAYMSGPLPHHVLAMRVAGGASTGPREIGRLFRLGGAAPNADVLDFGRGALSLLRGFGVDAFAGRRAAVANVEYRLPLTRIEEGVGTWPAFVRTVHGAVFVDVGHAWTDGFRAADVKTSAGAEASMDLVLGYVLPMTVTVGGAYGHDGAGRAPSGATAYVRIGRAF